MKKIKGGKKMKKRFKVVAAIMLTAAMVFGTAACGGGGSGSDSDSSSTGSNQGGAETATVDTSGVAGIDGWEAFGETVKITVPVYDRAREGFPAVDDNYWTQWVQQEFGEKYNIEVEYVAIPRGDVMTKYSMLIAAGETPTIMMEYDYPKVAQWASDGAMQAINLDDFAHVAPNYYGRMEREGQLQYSTINGDTYFILSSRPYNDTTFTYVNFIRKDWLDQVGLDVPTDYAQLQAAVKAFQDNGLSDNPMGLSLPTNGYARNYPFRDHPVNEAEWAMHSSLATASFGWEPMEKMLRRQNAEYNAGWYSPEYELDTDGTQVDGGSQQLADFINGKIATYGGYMSQNVDWLNSFYEANPEGELVVLPDSSAVEAGVVDQPIIRADNPFGMIVGFSSLADSDELKAAWMLMEWMMQPEVLFEMENGYEGVTYEMDEDGIPMAFGDYRGEEMLNHNNNIDMTCLVHASKEYETIEKTIKAITPKGVPQDFFPMIMGHYENLRAFADGGYAYTDPIFAVDIVADSEYSATLLALYQEFSVQLTKCSPDEFDALYERLSQEYIDNGYQEVMDERLAAYEAGNSTKLPK